MINKTINTTIEILGKIYPVRCLESELSSLQEAANFLSRQMSEVQDSGKVINLERIAIITALNISHQLLQANQQKKSIAQQLDQRLMELYTKLDHALRMTSTTEPLYSTE